MKDELLRLAEQFDRVHNMDSGFSYLNDRNLHELHTYGERAGFLYTIIGYGPKIAAALRKAEATDETAWLIEWPDNELLPLRWYVPGKPYTRNPHEALRFARKEDAEKFIRVEGMQQYARAIEHAWIAPASCCLNAAPEGESDG